jgi:hypothetical protein
MPRDLSPYAYSKKYNGDFPSFVEYPVGKSGCQEAAAIGVRVHQGRFTSFDGGSIAPQDGQAEFGEKCKLLN